MQVVFFFEKIFPSQFPLSRVKRFLLVIYVYHILNVTIIFISMLSL